MPTAPLDTARTLDASSLLQQARRLSFRFRAAAALGLAGAYHSARPGFGLTFAELRPYEPGDDVRHIDWNVTARQQRPYVRRYVEERSLNLYLVVDTSASLRFGQSGSTKWDIAIQASAILAAAAVMNQDRVGLTLLSDRVETHISPASGQKHLCVLLRTLLDAPPRPTPSPALVSNLLAQHLLKGRRSLVVLLSDFLDLSPPHPWLRLSRKHDVVAFRIVDPREESLPDAGLIAMADAETGSTKVVDSSSSRVRKAYAWAARQRRDTFYQWCSAASIQPLDLSTSGSPVPAMKRWLDSRAPRPYRHH